MKKPNYNYLTWGGLFLTIGILLAGNIGGYWNVDLPFLLFYKGFWTLFIILPCVVSIIQNGFEVATTTAIVVSCLITSAKLGYLDFAMAKRLLLPLLLIIIGLSFFIGYFFPDQDGYEIEENTDQESTTLPSSNSLDQNDLELPVSQKQKVSSLREFASAFSSKTINYDNRIFRGCKLSTTFGELRLNISNAHLADPTLHIECSSMFGTVDIHVPEDVNVIVKGKAMFGGIHNYRKGISSIVGVPTIYINVICIVGGVDIR